MKTPLRTFVALALSISTLGWAADARYFRVAGPVASTITAVSRDGVITWTNAPTNATFTVQTATALLSVSNWTDWVQVPATNAATTHRVISVNPPVGMVFIPAGSFTMGNSMDTNEGDADELPLRDVYVSAFYMDRYPVTKAQWAEVHQWATNHGYNFLEAGLGKAGDHPVHTVSWFNRVKWCNARSEMEGLAPCYYTSAAQTMVYRTGGVVLSNACVRWAANGYRLPTEAEWEKAARAGASVRRFPWGDTISHSQANYYAAPHSYTYDISPTTGFHPAFDDVEPYTSPVGYFAPNAYGLYDMSGNVWEWCWDVYDPYPAGPQIDPHGPNAAMGGGGVPRMRVMRGGGWGGSAYDLRCSVRTLGPPINASYTAGSRCVRGL